MHIEETVPLIDDFVDRTGRILNYDEFRARHGAVRINPLWYLAWCRAIPNEWKTKLLGSEQLTAEQRCEEPVININDKEVPLRLVKSSFFYALSVPDIIPTAQKRWVEEGVDFGTDWIKIHGRSFRTTASTKLQSLQYKIIHRFFPTRRFLCTRNVISDPFCDNCGEVETIEHYFFLCDETNRFWQDLAIKLNEKFPPRQHIIFTCKSVIFGCDKDPALINLFILVAKQAIVIQHYKGEAMNFAVFRSNLVKMFEMEKTNARCRDRMDDFRSRWAAFITPNVQLEL